MRRSLSALLALVPLFLLFLPPGSARAQWSLRDVAWTGAEVQDELGAPLVFDTFYYGEATLSAASRVLLSASARAPQDPEFSGPRSFWLETNEGIFEAKFKEGQALAGQTDRSVPLPFYGRVDQSEDGTVLLSGNFDNPNVFNDSATLLNRGNGWETLVALGDPVARPWSFDGSSLTVAPGNGPFHGDTMAFLGLLLDSQGSDISETSLFVAQLGQPLRELIRTREDLMPDLTGDFQLLDLPGMPEQKAPFLEMNESGQIALTASGQSTLNGNVARVLYRVAPDGTFTNLLSETAATIFALTLSIEHVRINAAGQVAVAGVLPGLGEGVWVFDGPSQARKVLDYGELNTLDGETIVDVLAMALTDDGHVVVQGLDAQSKEGIWAETDLGMVRVAKVGEPIPGISGKEFGGSYGIGGMVVNRQGMVAFTAGIRDQGGVDQYGDPNGLWIGGPDRIDLVAQSNEFADLESGQSMLVQYINLPGSPYGQLIAEAAYGTGAGGWGNHFSEAGDLAVVLNGSPGMVFAVANRQMIVNSGGDQSDLNLQDGICDIGIPAPDGGPTCTLRAAIEQANAKPGPDKIRFEIPQSDPSFDTAKGVWRLRPNGELPVVQEQVDLRGTTDGLNRPDVWLEGSSAGPTATGLSVGPSATGTALHDLVVGNWSLDGIHFSALGVTIDGCYLGTGTGGEPLGNGRHGILVDATGVEVGGASLPRNVITGNARHGVAIEGDEVTGVLVANCQLGGDSQGTFALGNGGAGVFIDAARGCLIGGSDAGAGNLICRNGGNGVTIQRRAKRNLVIGNAIGTDPAGIFDLANGNHGIYVDDSPRVRIESNIIGFHDRDSCAGIRGSESVKLWALHNEIVSNDVGISMWRCNQNFVSRNFIHHNQCGVDVNATLRVSFTLNRIENNQDNTCTGLHAYGSSLTVTGNLFTGDAGNGISLQDGSTGAIHENLLYGNVGQGVENFDPSVLIDATNNWWGDASGPGGDGAGSGEEVAGNVDYSSWATAQPALAMAASSDTLYLAPGERDEVGVFLRNWTVPADVVDFSVSDELGWLLTAAPTTLTLNGSDGAEFRSEVEVPPGVSPKAPNHISIEATSQSDPSDTKSVTVVVVPYQPVLTSIALAPDTLQVAPGGQYDFVAVGLDQLGEGIGFTPSWQTTGGTVDANGHFTAGSQFGDFEVTVEGPGGNPSSTAVVQIVDASVANGEDEGPATQPSQPLPRTLTLEQNFPNPFNPRTTIRFGLPQSASVHLEIFDLRGRRVRSLVSGETLPAGAHERVWRGMDERGHAVASGVYLYRLRAGEKVRVERMLLIR